MQITRAKKDFIRRQYIAGQLSVSQLAVALGLQRATIRFYINEFKKIEQQFPEKLTDYDFFISKEKVAKETQWHRNLIQVLPELVAAEPGPVWLPQSSTANTRKFIRMNTKHRASAACLKVRRQLKGIVCKKAEG